MNSLPLPWSVHEAPVHLGAVKKKFGEVNRSGGDMVNDVGKIQY